MTDIDEIRKTGQSSKVYLIIDDPTVLYRAHATGAVDQTDYSIAFTVDGTWTLGDCLEDMTLLIGTDQGGCDLGIARLRKAPVAGIFYIGADPSLVIAAGNHLTVLDDFEIWAKHPNGANLDVDVAVGTAFTAFKPLPWFNGRYAVIEAGGTAKFDATKCWVPGNTIASYAWTFTGATSSTGANTATPTAHYHTSGRYRVDLVVTATTTGETYTGHGYVYVLGANIDSEVDFIWTDPEGDSDSGWVGRVELIDRPTITDRRRVILYAVERFGCTPDNAGMVESFGPVSGRENILMVGWIDGETIKRTPGQDTVEFEVGGPLSILASVAAQPAGIQDTSFPTDEGQTPLTGWATQTGLTVAKILQYLALYRSTIGRCLDFYVEDWVWLCPKLTSESDNLLGQLQDFAARAALTVRADRLGRVFIERDTQLYPYADRTANIPVAVTLADTDWQGELDIIRRQRGETAMATAEGIIYFLAHTTQVGGRSPGEQPSSRGGVDSLSDLYVSTQGDVLELSGLMAGSKNQEIAAITVVLAENNRLMDVAPRMFVNVPVDGTTYRCIVRRMTIALNPESGFMHTELELEPEGSEWPSVVITYPGEGEPPVEPPTEPPTPPEPPGEPPEPPDELSSADAVVCIATDVQTTADLNVASPTWTSEL